MERNDYTEKITVDIKGLQDMLSLGKNKSMEIGKKSGAVIHLSSRRTLYRVDKVKSYINSLSEDAEV